VREPADEAAPVTSEPEVRLLLVDDTPANLNLLCELLEGEAYSISIALDGLQALELAREIVPDLILLDVMMPGIDGYEVCRRLKADPVTCRIPVVFVTAQGQTEGVVAGFEAGGVDWVTKPFREQEVLARVRTHLQVSRLSRELERRNQALAEKNAELERSLAQRRRLKGQLTLVSEREAEHWGLEGFVGRSATLGRIFAEVRLLQESTGTSVLIAGESGTGKELIARALHYGSPRREGPFVPVNCAALPRELVESLLFGHLRGAFTGADADRLGYFEMAHEGTLFLDEIGEMPLELQAKLLRVLEDGLVRRVGERDGHQVDVRVVAATNQDLTERIRNGTFRQDLYFRLARFTVTAPPLRERREDIPLLAEHFLRLFAREMGREPPELTGEALEALNRYAFPGNVRELKNIIERALLESRGGPVRGHHLHLLGALDAGSGTAPVAAAGVGSDELPDDLDAAVARIERLVLHRALDRTGGNIAEAARLLNTNRNRVYRILEQEREEGVS
jgi:DNA-binding NtrC family response regulator